MFAFVFTAKQKQAIGLDDKKKRACSVKDTEKLGTLAIREK